MKAYPNKILITMIHKIFSLHSYICSRKIISVIQLIILVLVMILYKNINDYDEKYFIDSISEANSSPKNKQTVEYRHRENRDQYNASRVDGAVVFEPILILDLIT
jgi:hypothetical protein